MNFHENFMENKYIDKLNLLSPKQRIINTLFTGKNIISLKINPKLFINQNTNVTRFIKKNFSLYYYRVIKL